MDILGFTLLGRSVLLSYHLQMNTRMVAYSGATLTITRSLTLAWRKSMTRLPLKPCTTGRMIAATSFAIFARRGIIFMTQCSCGIHDSVSRSEEHTSELQSIMRISYAVFCLKKKKQNYT